MADVDHHYNLLLQIHSVENAIVSVPIKVVIAGFRYVIRLHASSAGPVIRGLRLIHDQPHTDSKVLSKLTTLFC